MSEILIENTINDHLTGEIQKNALDFLDFMRTNELLHNAADGTSFSYLGEEICLMIQDDKAPISGWIIFWADCDIDNGEHGNFCSDERLIDFAQNNVNICTNFRSNGKNCGCGQQPGERRIVFGKEYYNCCSKCTLCFSNPSAESLESIKKLVEIRKHSIAEKKKK